MGPHGASAYAFGRCWQIPIHIRLLGVPQPLLLFLIGSPDKRLELPDLAARFLKGCSGRRLTSPLVRRRPDQHSETLYPATENTTLETVTYASVAHPSGTGGTDSLRLRRQSRIESVTPRFRMTTNVNQV